MDEQLGKRQHDNLYKKVRVDELKKVAPNRVKNKQARQRLQLKNGGQKFSFLPLLYESNGSYLN